MSDAGHEKKEHDAKKEGHGEEAAKNPTAAKDTLFSKAGDKVLEWSGTIIKGISTWVSSSVRGTLSGAWKATGGAVVGGVVGLGQHIDKSYQSLKSIGSEIIKSAKQRHHIGKLGPVLRGIMLGTAVAVGNAIYTPAAVAAGSAMSITEGAQNIVDGVTVQYDKHKAGGGNIEPAAGHEAPHAPAH